MADVDPFRVLLVEDNRIDARAIGKAFEGSTVDYSIDVVEDGDQAIEYLASGRGGRPDLVLLDLNLPGRDGLDVLDRVKADPALRRIPVLVVTTSSSDVDVKSVYDRGANAFVSKPVDLAGWRDLVARIEGFWFSVVRLPPS